MNDTAPDTGVRDSVDALPNRFADGGTFLLACAGDPTSFDVDLRALCEFGSPDETAFIVTTTRSAADTVTAVDAQCEKSERPALGLVDTTSAHQSVSSLFGGTPTIYTPSPGDLERLVLALSELTDRFPPGNAPRHLLVQSLTPILQTTTVDRLCQVLQRIAGIRTQTGLCLFGIDYTAHDSDTMTAIGNVVDGILWITPSDDGVEFGFQHTRTPGRYSDPQEQDPDT